MFLISLTSILSMVTGDSKIRSGVLEADTTTSSKAVAASSSTTLILWSLLVISTFVDAYPISEISKVKGGF